MKQPESMEEWLHNAKKEAMSILQRRDRSEKEVRSKMKEKGYPDSVIEVAIEYVKGFHYIDDYRFACNYIRSNMSEKARSMIRMELKNKGVDSENIDMAIEEEYNLDERSIITSLLERKFKNADFKDEKEYKRIVSYFLRRGFLFEDIKSAIYNIL